MDDTPRIADLRKKIEKDPASRLFAQLAEELRKDGRFEEAIAVARKGLERHPNYPSARLTLGRALLDSGRPGDARSEIEQVVRASPDNILASKFLGDALDDLGEPAQALAQYELGLKLSPGDRALIERMDEVRLKLRAAAFVPPDPPAAQSAPVTENPPVTQARGGGPEASEALDRDLASGTFRPGAFNPADLVPVHGAAVPAPLSSPSLVSAVETEPLVEGVPKPSGVVGQAVIALGIPLPLAHLHPAAETTPTSTPVVGSDEPVGSPVPSSPDDVDIGGQTLPITSVTLADLYLQQGLRAEASEVLNRVLRSEPQNTEAMSLLATATGPGSAGRPDSSRAAQEQPPPRPSHQGTAPAQELPSTVPPKAVPVPQTAPDSGPVAVPASLAESGMPLPNRTAPTPKKPGKGVGRAQIKSLGAFLDAAEREANQQRATAQSPGAFQ